MLQRILIMTAVMFSASVALAGEYEGTTVEKQISRSGQDLDGDSEYSFTISSDVYRITSELKWIEESVWECEDETSGDGSQGDWKGFFNVPKDRKSVALADAIKGVGLSTAKKLVEDNYFSSKPRSWRSFAKVIENADNDYETGFSYEVLVKFKKENMTSLGYIVEGKCGYVTRRALRRVPVKKFHHTENRDFLVTIKGGSLLNGETENFKVIFDGFESEIVSNSRFNNYTSSEFEEGTKVVFELNGERQQVTPPNGLSISAKRDGSKLLIDLTDKNFSEDIDTNARRYVNITVKKDGFLFFNKKIAELEVEFEPGSEMTIDEIDAKVKKGQKILIMYSIEYRDSKYYNTKSSRDLKLKTRL